VSDDAALPIRLPNEVVAPYRLSNGWTAPYGVVEEVGFKGARYEALKLGPTLALYGSWPAL
jgi:hypothetical protein